MTEVDEELPGQDRRSLRRGVRIALGIAALLVVAAATVLIVRAGGAPKRSAHITPVPTPPTEILPRSTNTPTSSCGAPDPTDCYVTIGVPHAVVSAVRAILPGATIDASSTVTGRDDAVTVRTLSVQPGDLRITVRVAVGTGHYYRVSEGDYGTFTRLVTEVGRHRLIIEVTDPARAKPIRRASLERLAADPRLLATA